MATTLSKKERKKLVEKEGGEISVKEQVKLLGVSRSSVYYEKKEPSEEEVKIKHRIDELYTDYPFYGSRKMAAQLRRESWMINRKRVQRYMREMGLEGIRPSKKGSKKGMGGKIYPYLLTDLKASYPNQVWGVDITYIRLKKSWVYLVAILDWYSRYVVSWEIDQTLEMPFVLTSVDNALSQGRPEIINSDQGSHFTSPLYLRRFEEIGTQISMDGRGRALDNVFTERLWRSVKYEEVYLNEYLTPKEARQGLSNYFHFYNHQRPHQSLGYLVPAELY